MTVTADYFEPELSEIMATEKLTPARFRALAPKYKDVMAVDLTSSSPEAAAKYRRFDEILGTFLEKRPSLAKLVRSPFSPSLLLLLLALLSLMHILFLLFFTLFLYRSLAGE